MDSRSAILGRIKKNKPQLNPVINLAQFAPAAEQSDWLEIFETNLKANGGTIRCLQQGETIQSVLTEEVADHSFVDLSGTVIGGYDLESLKHPKELADVKILIANPQLGVAENAALWFNDTLLSGIRALPFIVERTIFVLEKEKLVPTMHRAYEKLGELNTGFGTFIAGPSKTADIEQNLVIGAHGTKSHLVVLV